MAWDYRPRAGTIEHVAGTVPPRPLVVGDALTWPSGYTDMVIATTDRLLLFAKRPTSPMFREPIEGDDSRAIYAIEE